MVKRKQETFCLGCKKTVRVGHRCKKLINLIKETLTYEFLLKEYVENQKSLPELQAETHINFGTIHRKLKEFGLSRTVKESCQVQAKAEKAKQTNLKKTGFPHNFCKNHPSRKRWEAELLAKEGISNVFQRQEVKDKIGATLLERYGVESSALITTARGKNSYSNLHKEVVSTLLKYGIKLKIEKKIKKDNGYYYSFDIFIEPNILIEVQGDYWHGNPLLYKPTDLIMKGSSAEQTVSSIWKRDILKREKAIEQGFRVIVVWEFDWKTEKEKTLKRLLDDISSQDKVDQESSAN